MTEQLIRTLLFFHETFPGTGMSEDLFFTKIYFWIFLLIVIGLLSVVTEVHRYITAAVFCILTISFAGLWWLIPGLGWPFLWWSFFAFWIIYYSVTEKRMAARNVFLFVVSLFFYYKTSGFFFLILIFSTLLDYTMGLSIYHAPRQWQRKLFVVISITINLLMLAYFKYAYFFTESYNELVYNLNQILGANLEANYQVENFLAKWANESFSGTFEVGKILLPVGISFFTFQTISYTVDIYRRKIKPLRNILDFGFYVSFFPQLVSGPIVRAADFIPQMYKPYRISSYHFGLGLFWILNGILKKAFLADFIANGFIDGVYEDPLRYTGFENLMAMFGYSLQVYADFSGYTDIAIGVALLLGFRLNTNFNSPYKANNVGEFWKRWHISLSTWLRDYLYIPIGGNRKGTVASYILIGILLLVTVFLSGEYWILTLGIGSGLSLTFWIVSRYSDPFKRWVNTNVNLMVTMAYGGLWHGSSWNFVIWGSLNGIGLVVYKLWRKISPWEKVPGIPARALRIGITLSFITFTRIFFRSPDMQVARDMMHQLVNGDYLKAVPQVLDAFWLYYSIMVIGYIIHWIDKDVKRKYRHMFIRAPLIAKAGICVIAIYIAYQSLQGAQPFIYFQF